MTRWKKAAILLLIPLAGCNGGGGGTTTPNDPTPTLLFANATDGTQSALANDIAVDSQGDFYVTGFLLGSSTFGTTTLTSAGGFDVFLAKYSGTDGSVLWAMSAGGPLSDMGRGVAVDQNDNVIITGIYSDGAVFNGNSLPSRGALDVYVFKYTSAGNPVWGFGAGSQFNDDAYAVDVNPFDEIVFTGGFSDTMRFEGEVLVSVGSKDGFVWALRSNGTSRWVRTISGTGSNVGTAVANDASGNVIVGGTFWETAQIGTDMMTAKGTFDGFLASWDRSGDFRWSTQIGGTDAEDLVSVGVDANGRIAVTGVLRATADFGGIEVTPDNGNAFVARYGQTGAPAWVRTGGGSGGLDRAASVAQSGGHFFVTGRFYGPADFSGETLDGFGSDDIFLARYDANGDLVSLLEYGGPGIDQGFGVAIDGDGNLITVGGFVTQIEVGEDTFTSTSTGYEVLVMKHEL